MMRKDGAHRALALNVNTLVPFPLSMSINAFLTNGVLRPMNKAAKALQQRRFASEEDAKMIFRRTWIVGVDYALEGLWRGCSY